MREDKTKITVEYQKSNNAVTGFFPNRIDYPTMSFVSTDEVGYIEITKSEWENRSQKDIVNGNSIEEYIKPDSELLQEAQEAKIAQLAINREVLAEKTTITYNGKTYANSQNARIAIINYKLELDDVTTKPYFTYPEREVVNLLKADFVEMANLIESNESTLRQQEAVLIATINACETVAEVNDINIDLS